jgi:hypothetical protein
MSVDASKPPTYMNKTQAVWNMIVENPDISETGLKEKLPHIVEGTIGASLKMLYEYGHISRTGSGQFNQRKRELFKFKAIEGKPYEPFYGTRPEDQGEQDPSQPKRVVLNPPAKIPPPAGEPTSRKAPTEATPKRAGHAKVKKMAFLSLEIGEKTVLVPVEEARLLYEELHDFFRKS